MHTRQLTSSFLYCDLLYFSLIAIDRRIDFRNHPPSSRRHSSSKPGIVAWTVSAGCVAYSRSEALLSTLK